MQLTGAGSHNPGNTESRRYVSPPGWLLASLVAVGMAASGWAAAQHVYSVLPDYDDEAYIMLSLRSYLAGQPLYRSTYTQYGPAYYQFQSMVHGVSGWPVNHDITRTKTWFAWMAAAACAAGLVWRMQRNAWMAWATFLAAAFHLDKLCLEPGHPQELCLLATLACLLVAMWLPRMPSAAPGKSLIVAIIVGGLCGLTVMTKVNVGGLLAAAVATSLALHAPRSLLRSVLLFAAVTVLLLIPAAVCRQCFQVIAALPLPVLAIVGSASVCWWFDQKYMKSRESGHDNAASGFAESDGQDASWYPLSGFLVGLTIVILASSAVCLSQGTKLAELRYGLVTQHLGFDRYFFNTAPVFWPACLLGVGLLVVLPLAGKRPLSWEPLVGRVALFVVLGLVAGFLLATGKVSRHGLEMRGFTSWLLSFGPLLAWALAWPQPASATDDDRDSMAKDEQRIESVGRSRTAHRVPATAQMALALASCLMPLMAYPTPGTQVELGTLLLLAVLMVVLARRWAPTQSNNVRADSRPLPKQRYGWILQPAVLLVLLLTGLMIDRDVRWTLRRQGYVALNLPGASLLRLPPAQAERELALVRAIRQEQPRTFTFAEHGQNRFYLWTETEPPTACNATFWPYMFNHSQQLDIIRAMERYENQDLLVISMQNGDKLLPAFRLPLREYLERRFTPARQVGKWQIWKASRAPSTVAIAAPAVGEQ